MSKNFPIAFSEHRIHKIVYPNKSAKVIGGVVAFSDFCSSFVPSVSTASDRSSANKCGVTDPSTPVDFLLKNKNDINGFGLEKKNKV